MSKATFEKLTQKEKSVLFMYICDDNVNDYGYDSDKAACWTKGCAKDCNMSGKSFSGVMASLTKKKLIISCEDGDDSFFSLTPLGMELCLATYNETVEAVTKVIDKMNEVAKERFEYKTFDENKDSRNIYYYKLVAGLEKLVKNM